MKAKASRIYGWLQNAVCDLAQGEMFPYEDWDAIMARSDVLFEDTDTLRDLISDQILNEVGGYSNKKEMLELAEALIEIAHDKLVMVLENFIEDHKLRGE